MNELEIRKAIIYDRAGVKYLMLTKHAAELVKLIIIKGSISTSELSELKGISVQNSSMQLKKLYEHGYLKRKEIKSETGGIEYIYKSVVFGEYK